MTVSSRVVLRIALFLSAVVPAARCGGGSCGLALQDRVTLAGSVPCCGSLFRDIPLAGRADSEFDLSNIAQPALPGLVDAFLVPTSCANLFEGPYPGSVPRCQVYSGPAAPGRVSSRVALPPGTYRLWLQAYSTNTSDAPYFVDIGIWDHRCRSPIQ